jgi:hypothetical protein
MIEWVVKQVSILLHLIIPEFPGIPGNSYRFLLIIQFRNSRKFLPIPSYYPIPEFRAELDDRMGSQTSINSITSYNSGIPRNS